LAAGTATSATEDDIDNWVEFDCIRCNAELAVIEVEETDAGQGDRNCSLLELRCPGRPGTGRGCWDADVLHDLKVIIERAFNEAGMLQREDVRKLNDTLESDLAAKGMVINRTEPDSFREQLQKSGFYKEWKTKFGDETWALLEESAGKPL